MSTNVNLLDFNAQDVTPLGVKKNHRCPWQGCGRMFTCPHNVEQHVREKHTGEKPFRCVECKKDGMEKGFARPYCLYRHLNQIHGIQAGPGKGRGAQRRKAQTNSDSANPESINGGRASTAAFNHLPEQEFQPYQTSGQSFPAYEHLDPELDDLLGFEVANHGYKSTAQGLPFHCDHCKSAFTTQDAILTHMHNDHHISSSPFCTCSVCNLIHRGSDEGAVKLAYQLQGGGFEVGWGEGPETAINEVAGTWTKGGVVIDPELDDIFPQVYADRKGSGFDYAFGNVGEQHALFSTSEEHAERSAKVFGMLREADLAEAETVLSRL